MTLDDGTGVKSRFTTKMHFRNGEQVPQKLAARDKKPRLADFGHQASRHHTHCRSSPRLPRMPSSSMRRQGIIGPFRPVPCVN